MTDNTFRSSSPSKLRYVYNQKACGKCGGVIKVWTIAQRYWTICNDVLLIVPSGIM